MGLGDGRVLHFGERDCSMQRRYQKMIEEAPAAALPDATRRAAAQGGGRPARRRSATATPARSNSSTTSNATTSISWRSTRASRSSIPVSEMITGVDLVQPATRGRGRRAAAASQQPTSLPRGHAIEARILAEDPDRDFRPRPGRITRWRPPRGEGVRVDTAIEEGATVPPYYDSMIAKLIVHARRPCRAPSQRLRDALERFEVDGIATNIPLAARDRRASRFPRQHASTRAGWKLFSCPPYGQPKDPRHGPHRIPRRDHARRPAEPVGHAHAGRHGAAGGAADRPHRLSRHRSRRLVAVRGDDPLPAAKIPGRGSICSSQAMPRTRHSRRHALQRLGRRSASRRIR